MTFSSVFFKSLKIQNYCCVTKRLKSSYIHFIGKDPLVYRNVGQHFDVCVEKFGERDAIVSCHENKRLSYKQCKQETERIAAGFQMIGLKRGDRIGIWSPNNIHWYLTMIAAAKAGLVSVGINPNFQAPELEYCINKVGIKAIVAAESFKSQSYYELFEKIAPEICKTASNTSLNSSRIPSLHFVIMKTDNEFPGIYRFDDIANLASNDLIKDIQKTQEAVQPDSPLNIQFTSGTTGSPKATVLSHFSFVNNGIHIGNRNELNLKHHKICTQVPLFHAFGVVGTIMNSISHGATIVLPHAGFSATDSLKAIVKEKCTVIHGTPTMYVDLIKKQKELNYPIESAEIALTGGAICPPRLMKDMKEVLKLKKLKMIYGLTETTAAIFQSVIDDSDENILSTVGHIQDHVEAKVIDPEGNTVPFGQPGELCIRGYVNMLGYFNDEAKTKEMIGDDRWLRTGDKFILEENGYGKIVGRLKDMIIRGGENIFPKEIENFLCTHPDIIEAHVIGVPDERLGEEVCAFLRFDKDQTNLTQDEIKKFCKGKIANFKIPRYVYKVKDFPKTTSGKVQKFKLKELFKNELKSN